MKKLFYLYFPNLFVFFLLLICEACHKDEVVAKLTLDQTSLNMQTGSQASVQILSGNGNYSLSFSPSGIVTAEINDQTILLTAQTAGETHLSVKDQAGQNASVQISVTPTPSVTPRFVWDTTIPLEIPNDWSITRFSDRIAITNLVQNKQYLLSWQGGLSVGNKTQATLKIATAKQAVETLSLTSLSISENTPGYFTLSFSRDNQKGELTFAK